ncbi:MAG: dienelactone hydrolase family protein [Pseudomonadota bacterium]|nr:dienelactone hydrolase family protein [Pseudomonadota bacterium]
MVASAPRVEGFEASDYTFVGQTRPVYVRGEGHGVLLMHEVPGITPQVRDCAQRIADAGFSVYMPWMFGTPNKPVTIPYAMGQLAQAICIRREFSALARGRSSPITDWLRALARQIHAERGGPGVGAVGMCLTGGFALTLMLEPAVIAPVLSQPSCPMPLPGLAKKNGPQIDIAPQDLERVKQRLDEEDLTVVGLRFTEDAFCPRERFATLKQKLGERFEAIEIDSSPGNPHGFGKMAHSVLTMEFRDEPGFPTKAAMDRVIAFYRERLGSPVQQETT